MFRIIKLGNVSARFVCLITQLCVGALLLEQGIDREVSDVPGSVAHFFDASEYKFHIMKDNGKSMQENQ